MSMDYNPLAGEGEVLLTEHLHSHLLPLSGPGAGKTPI